MCSRILAIVFAILVPVLAYGQAAPGAYGTGSGAGATSPSLGSIVIGTLERRILQDYFQRQLDLYNSQDQGQAQAPVLQPQGGKPDKHKKNVHKNKGKGNKRVPPGLAKKGGLPPGIAKQLVANQPLPSGVDYRPLPRELLSQLPQPQSGTRYLLADDRVLLVQSATNLILDTLQVAAADLL